MSYVPQRGTLPARVVAYLDRLPRGTKVPTGVLTDELDVESTALLNCMDAAVRADMVVREKIESRWHWGPGPGRGVDPLAVAKPAPPPPPPPPPPPMRPPPPAAPPRPTPPPAASQPIEIPRELHVHAGVFTTGDVCDGKPAPAAALPPPNSPSSAAAAAPPPQAAPDPEARAAYARLIDQAFVELAAQSPPEPARFALWSNGMLEIRRETVADAADFVLLTKDETRALLHYLDRIAVGEGE